MLRNKLDSADGVDSESRRAVLNWTLVSTNGQRAPLRNHPAAPLTTVPQQLIVIVNDGPRIALLNGTELPMYWNELRTALRKLSRSGGFLFAAALVLALGLGANLVLFNTIYALLWRPLDFPQSERLVSVYNDFGEKHKSPVITVRQGEAIRQQVPSVDAVGLFSNVTQLGSDPNFILEQNAAPVEFSALMVNSDYFRALGVQPLAGRFFGDEQDRGQGTEKYGIITESTWRKYFNADPSVINRLVPFKNGGKPAQVRILGIAPDNVILGQNELRKHLDSPPLLLPLTWLGPNVYEGCGYCYFGILRLKPGLTFAQASTQIDTVCRQAKPDANFHYSVAPLRDLLAPVDRQTYFLLYGGSCLLLLLASINLANMFLVRYLERMRDTVVRLALGAPLGSVLRLNLYEALFVCAMGTAMAFESVRLSSPLVVNFVPSIQNFGAQPLAVSWTAAVIGITLCLAIACAVSIMPAWIVKRAELATVLALGGREKTDRRQWWRTALVVGQIAIAMVLLSVAGLLGRSFVNALKVDPGFNARGVLTFHLSLPESSNMKSSAEELRDMISAVPNVQQVSFADSPFFQSSSFGIWGENGGSAPSTPIMSPFHLVGDSYLETLGPRLYAGRLFTKPEIQTQADMIVINRRAAQALFPGNDPLGRIVHLGLGNLQSTVVGVVENMREGGLDQEPNLTVYMPYFSLTPGQLNLFVRTSGDPNAAIPIIKARLAGWNRRVFMHDPRLLEDDLKSTIKDRLTSSTLMGGFAILGLIVSAVGLYGALATQVQRQYREIGVRIALGASIGVVVRKLLVEGLLIVASGAALGVVVSVAMAPLLEHQLYKVRAIDAPSLAAAFVLLVLAALVALLVPTLRVTRVNPVDVLRVE